MIKKTTLALVAALAVTSFASPVFAQSYNPCRSVPETRCRSLMAPARSSSGPLLCRPRD